MKIEMATRRLFSFSSQSQSSTNPVKWGILSAGRIASDYAKAISVTEGAVALAVGARCRTKAKEFAALQLHGIDTSYGSSYQDVVYIATTADHHFEWAKQSLRA